MRAVVIFLMLLASLPATAQTTGPVTGFDLPRFVSLKAASANVRRGPGLTHRIDWRFLHRGMPLQVVAEYDNWRQVQDADGLGGWIHFSLLSGNRSALVGEAGATLYAEPDLAARIIAEAEPGAILRLSLCERDWCSVSADGHEGWAQADGLWGTDADLGE